MKLARFTLATWFLGRAVGGGSPEPKNLSRMEMVAKKVKVASRFKKSLFVSSFKVFCTVGFLPF